MSNEAFICDAIRTLRGRGKRGSLHGTKPIDLVVGLIDELRRRHPGLDRAAIDDIVLGVGTPSASRAASRRPPPSLPTSLTWSPVFGSTGPARLDWKR